MNSFNVENIFTWGLVHDKDYGGYKLPISFRDEPKIVGQIQKLVEKQKVKPIFYGDSKTVYFKLWHISETQTRELLEQGRCYVDIMFEIGDKPIESRKTGELYLNLKVTGLRKNAKVVLDSTPKDEF